MGYIAFALIAGWSLLHCWRGLFVYFSNDDIMNMYWARELSPGRLLLSALVPFTTVYRPTGAVYYRCLYALFGLWPLPFRIVFYLLLAATLVLLYKVAGPAVGVVAAFLGSFHSRFTDLYLNNGTIYDVLCGCFYLGALYYYMRMRSTGRSWGWRQYLVLYLLATAALNAKEAGATLPLILLIYELLWHRKSYLWKPILLVTLVMLAGTWARFEDGSRLMNNPAYGVHLNLGLSNTAAYLNDLFYLHWGALNAAGAVLIIACLFSIAAMARSKILLFWALFILISPLPVMFIPHRGLYAYFLPVLGWAAFAASCTVYLRISQAVAVLLLAGALLFTHNRIVWNEAMPANSMLCELHRGLLARVPSLPLGSRVLLLDDPLPPTWTALMLVRLTYNDLSLNLIRPKQRGKAATPQEFATADAVIRF